MTVADYIARTLSEMNIRHVFGYIGARNILLVDAIYQNDATRFVNVYHEQTAAFAACAYAQSGARVGVALSTSGPGGTNMLTGVAQAFCDSIPVVFLTGQAATGALRGEAAIRNRTPQEVDIVGMARPVTKYAVQITRARDIRREMEKAFRIATTGRPGPVLIDLPEDVQRETVVADALEPDRAEERDRPPRADMQSEIKARVSQSRRPVLVVGNGAHGCENALAAIFRDVPTVASMSATDVYDNARANYLGVCGNYGLRCANFALSGADLILALGCAMNKRYTGNDLSRFAPDAKVIRVDVDEEELRDRTIKPDELKIRSDLAVFLDRFGSALEKLDPCDAWKKRTARYKEKYFREQAGIPPYDFMYALDALRGAKDIVTLDVGNVQIWALQALSFGGGRKCVSTSGLSSMGYALPAAIGAYCAAPDADIICVCGDGGLQMNIQELEFLKREQAPITIIVMNNAALGMIKTLQDTYYEGRRVASVRDWSAPDFAAVAHGYGVRVAVANSVGEFEAAFERRGKGPLLIEVKIDAKYDTYPRIVSRRPIWDMFPFLSDAERAENGFSDDEKVIL